MNEIETFYREECNEDERLNSQAGLIEYRTTMHYLEKYYHSGTKVLDACAGGGIYSFPLAEKGCKVVAGDLMDVNVLCIEEKNKAKNMLQKIYQGSCTDLKQFQDGSFDVVLNLGSYYHLCDAEERMESIRETLRVLKNGGIYYLAYINRCANYMAHFEELKDDFGFLVRYMEKGHIDNSYCFYASTPEMAEEELQSFPVEILHHVATDGPIFWYRDIVEDMSAEDFSEFMKIHMKICGQRSNLGYSEHGLIVMKKTGGIQK